LAYKQLFDLLILARSRRKFHSPRPLLSGRIIALVYFVYVGILAATATCGFGGDRVDEVFGGSCAPGFCYLVAPSWVAADDPQTLAEALMLGGLVSYISRPPDRIGLLRMAVLVTLGSFIKHNVVAISLAITFRYGDPLAPPAVFLVRVLHRCCRERLRNYTPCRRRCLC
jgi:hypothetical protein